MSSKQSSTIRCTKCYNEIEATVDSLLKNTTLICTNCGDDLTDQVNELKKEVGEVEENTQILTQEATKLSQ